MHSAFCVSLTHINSTCLISARTRSLRESAQAPFLMFNQAFDDSVWLLLDTAVLLRLCFHWQCHPFPRTTNILPPPLSPLKAFPFSLEFLAEERLDDTVFKALTPQDHSNHVYPQKYVPSKHPSKPSRPIISFIIYAPAMIKHVGAACLWRLYSCSYPGQS